MRMWKESFPASFTMYLLQEMREASRASLESCSFSGDEVDALGEGIDGGLLVTQIEDSDLGIGHTTAVARLDVRLVLTVSVATCRSY